MTDVMMLVSCDLDTVFTDVLRVQVPPEPITLDTPAAELADAHRQALLDRFMVPRTHPDQCPACANQHLVAAITKGWPILQKMAHRRGCEALDDPRLGVVDGFVARADGTNKPCKGRA